MNTYLFNVLLSFFPYLIIGFFMLCAALMIEPLARGGLIVKKLTKATLKKTRLFLLCAALTIWAFGLFLALSSPSNIPKTEVFDKAASHRAIVDKAEESREPPKQPVRDNTLKPKTREDRDAHFKSLTDYKSRTRQYTE
ncbi:hypothetical protein [Methylotuvimicrobium sp. KM2]|uniref:hypothetical protein n=1 Tax=Methylotuvimicrobium sp. KM2 TaxID=3133976 RepID=UPI003100F09D